MLQVIKNIVFLIVYVTCQINYVLLETFSRTLCYLLYTSIIHSLIFLII